MNCDDHTRCPSGYIEWHDWAEQKSKTHLQVKCPECGLYSIWLPTTGNQQLKKRKKERAA
jgi:hypothetical protein